MYTYARRSVQLLLLQLLFLPQQHRVKLVHESFPVLLRFHFECLLHEMQQQLHLLLTWNGSQTLRLLLLVLVFIEREEK